MKIVNQTIGDMKKDNNFQWDNKYPTIENFKNDIKNETLYVWQDAK